MKSVKRIIAVLLVAALAVSFCGCHKKGETAVKVGDTTFTTGYYACAFLEADLEARSEVSSDLQEAGKDTTDIDYSKQKVDGKKYETWVKNRTLEILKEIAAYEVKCKENKLEADADYVAELRRFFDKYWEYDFVGSSSGIADLSTIYEANGISKETAIQFCTDYASGLLIQQAGTYYQASEDLSSYTHITSYAFSDYMSRYYEYLYGEEGTEAPTDEELNTEILKERILVGEITVALTSTDDSGNETALDDTAKAEALKKANAYLEKLKKDPSQFVALVHENEGAAAEEESEETEEGAVQPLTEHAQVLEKDESDAYTKAAEMKTNEVALIGVDENGAIKEDATELIVLLRLDLEKDVYYLNEYRTTNRANVVYEMKYEDLEKTMKEFAGTLKFTETKSATKQFKTKKITYTGEK